MILSLKKAQIHLAIYSLIRIFAAANIIILFEL